MPGATPVLGIPFPLIGETVGPADFQALAAAVDALVTADEARVAEFLDRPMLRINTSQNAAVTVNVETSVIFTSVFIDNDGMFSAGTPDRVTIQTAGVYLFRLDYGIGNYTLLTSSRYGLFKNGVRMYAERKNESTGGPALETTLTGLVPCNVADFIQVRILWTGTGGPADDFGSLHAIRLVPL